MFVPKSDSNTALDLHARGQALDEAQNRFAREAKADSADATLKFAAEEIRVYRDGSFPAIGEKAAAVLLRAAR